ncbi:TIGR02680 family protein [Pseudonocardia oroxyli]|uniref:TIGR02680 family protein n=1 Tax=Pseudonocardia oroxyli TaxID=366584 RepID=A0A1G7ZS38_PSEOR|nr:TIGR02680 family protein [Pseudonocardia oroxyli]SDH10930.1 TIGR02680 family protein [Pseudonocardia oroxyli]
MTVTALRPTRQDTGSARWVPRRAGIQNVWRYYDEVFEFHRGRLLLRGSNGSGKSKALELLLPFLFDASLRAQRLSTFGTSERTMHWNLMGEGAAGKTRVGYVWLEFSRDAADGTRHWFVCGARLAATTHTRTAQADYFTLEREVAPGEFTTADSLPLTRAALVERIGDDGSVHGPAEHRAAVRSVLFGGIGEQRYESLILALLQLRTPKLSQRLDPALLSTLLSKALPPLGETELGELAEGFQRLDRQREELEQLEAEAEAARTLAVAQQTYARRVLRAAAAELITATTTMDDLTRAARENDEELGAARAEFAEASGALDRERALDRSLGVDIDELRGHTDYREGAEALRRVEDLRGRARGVRDRVATEQAAAAGAVSQAETDTTVAEEAAGELVEAQTAEAETVEVARAAAVRAGMESVVAEARPIGRSDRHRAAALVEAAATGRAQQIAEVRDVVEAHTAAVGRRSDLEDLLDGARTALQEAQDVVRARADLRAEALGAREERLREWVVACRELRVDEADVVAAADDEPTLSELVEDAVRAASEMLLAAAAELRVGREGTATRLAAVEEELATVRSARHVPPSAPPTRTADRAGRGGAPLWQLVDFAPDVPAEWRSALEAGLQSSGLLDAWLTPDGRADWAGHDVLADPADLALAPARSLADVLVPEPDTAVPRERILALLRVVAFDDALPQHHPAAFGADGTWRLGAVTGSWGKPEPEHIGATARARTRERRITELERDRDSARDELARLDRDLQVVADRRGAVQAERSRRPDRTALDAATRELRRAESDVSARDAEIARFVQLLGVVSAEVARLLRDLHEAAARTGLPSGAEDLSRLAGAVDGFRSAARGWLDRCGDLVAATRRAHDTETTAARSREAADVRRDAAADAAAELEDLEQAAATAEGAIGQTYRDLVAQLGELQQRRTGAVAAADTAFAQVRECELRIMQLRTRAERAEAERDTAVELRDRAGERMRLVGSGTFAADAGVDEPAAGEQADSVRATLDLARGLAARWAATPHEPAQIARAFGTLSDELYRSREILGVRADLELSAVADHHVLTASSGGVRTGAAGLADRVKAEATRAAEDITAAERQLFETTLTGDTRRHLADRIRQATALVDGMNARLDEVRTASRVAVRLDWKVDPDLPASARAARDLLLKDPSRLGEAEREALHRFFRDRVDEARARDDAVGWEQQLGEVFDYTSWHRFEVTVDRGKGEGWQVLTRKLHGALSGGEKAIALHLPLFAAVAAHYESVPRGPRVILLDEVFVGVDEVNRGQVFALLASLDLDLVLTSDHEWCAYSELDGIAVHQLVTSEDDDAVTTARFVWDGEDWLESEEGDD